MAEVQQRTSAPRGRGSGRGGRGGFSSRGGRTRGGAAGAREQVSEPVEEELPEEGQVGELKKQYGENLSTLKEMFPDWTNEDLLFALQETDGDLVQTIDHISGGNVSQWGEVKKKTKEKAKPAPKEVAPAVAGAPRNSRGRGGADSVRGARGGRGATRGRGAGRGGRGGLSTVGKSAVSTGEEQTPESDSLTTDINKDTAPAATIESTRESASPSASWEMVNAPEPEPVVEAPKSKQGLRPDGTRSWASLMHAPKPAVPLPTKLPIRREIAEEVPETKPQETVATQNEMDFVPNPDGIPASPPLPAAEPAVDFTPAKDELTEENLEQIKDSSQHISSQTVASTIGTDEPRADPGSLTPLPGQDQSTTSRPGLTGYAASALKATGGAVPRTPSYVRRIQQQQESVVMPNKQSIDRTAVQFGSLGLGSGSADVDVPAEEVPVTREQPPQHSPIAPRASLPPAPAASTLPARGAAEYSSTLPQTTASRPSHGQFDEQSRYDQYGGSLGPSQHNNYMAGFTGPQHGHASAGAYGQGQNDYNYYGADSSRNAPSGYPGYGQQTSSELHSLPKTSTAAQTSNTESQSTYPSGTQAAHSRYTVGGQDVQNSGHNTPAPVGQAAQQTQSQQGHSGAQQQTGSNAAYGSYNQQHNYQQSYYPYMNQGGYNNYGARDRPMYEDARRYEDNSYQYGYQNQSGYGGAPYNKYGQHSNYAQGYEQNSHASSGYGRDNSTYSSYGRGSTQPTETQGSLNTPSTSHAHTSEYSRQFGQGHYEESARGYTDKASGASPAAQSSIARTDSATGAQSSASQTQPQHSQQSQSQYGNYPSQQQSYGGYGSSGHGHSSHGGHSHHAYGQYNQQYGGNYYAGNQSRGNWGGNYGH